MSQFEPEIPCPLLLTFTTSDKHMHITKNSSQPPIPLTLSLLFRDFLEDIRSSFSSSQKASSSFSSVLLFDGKK